MHYKNGKQANEGDFVVGANGSTVLAGRISELSAQSQSCNARLSVSVFGGFERHYITISDFVLAEDAWRCFLAQHEFNPVAPEDMEHVTGSLGQYD